MPKKTSVRDLAKKYPKAAKSIKQLKKSRRIVTAREVAAQEKVIKAKEDLARAKNKAFGEGMVFALIQIVHENPACARDARSVFDAAGLTREDFHDTGIESDYNALNRILED